MASSTILKLANRIQNKYSDSRPIFLVSWNPDPIIRYRNPIRSGPPWWHCIVSHGDHWSNRRGSFAHARAGANGRLAKSITDIYFFRWIFHNWPDRYCVKICWALIPVLKPGALILIQEFLLPEPGTISCYQERKMRLVHFPVMGVERWIPVLTWGFSEQWILEWLGFPTPKSEIGTIGSNCLKRQTPGFWWKASTPLPNSG